MWYLCCLRAVFAFGMLTTDSHHWPRHATSFSQGVVMKSRRHYQRAGCPWWGQLEGSHHSVRSAGASAMRAANWGLTRAWRRGQHEGPPRCPLGKYGAGCGAALPACVPHLYLSHFPGLRLCQSGASDLGREGCRKPKPAAQSRSRAPCRPRP